VTTPSPSWTGRASDTEYARPRGRTGLLGGTFNPIHLGHLHVAQEALVALDLERVLFIPNRVPPHRASGPELVHETHRFAMVGLAVASNPRFFASRVDISREGPSYTVDTVETLRRESPDAELYFLTGADALMRYVWKDLDRLLGMLTAMVAVTRPGFALAALTARLDGLDLQNRDRVRTREIAGYALSSTEIRERLARGVPVHYMVPREVEDYIEKFGLYYNGGAT
jgi:nicotinate-nucleotide adenylyltransferase